MLDTSVIQAKRLTGQKWYEIDDIQDLDIAESIFVTDDARKLELIQKRSGGYWRYPKMLDFWHIANPYFPTQRMKDEIRASFDLLLMEHSSGVRVSSLLTAKNFNVKQENIIIGNGSEILISNLMSSLSGITGFIKPLFDEYPVKYCGDGLVPFCPDNKDYSYNAEDVIRYFDSKGIHNLVIINPADPSGNYIPRKDLLYLAEWAANKRIRLILDESLADFADETDNSLIDQDILDRYTELYVIKSVSISHGIPGLHIAALASGDVQTIAKLKEDIAIWSIDSFAEFYMQIEEKHKKDFVKSLGLFQEERKDFQYRLSSIEGLRVIPSQANYVMVELKDGIDSQKLLQNLLVNHNILVKELTNEMNSGHYLRLAIRNHTDNAALVSALKMELGSMIAVGL